MLDPHAQTDQALRHRLRFGAEPETVPEGLIRLSVGIEHVEDLWEDLQQALRAVTASASPGR